MSLYILTNITKCFQKRENYSRGDIIQGEILVKEIGREISIRAILILYHFFINMNILQNIVEMQEIKTI